MNRFTITVISLLSIILSAVTGSSAAAESAATKGLAIAREADRRDLGFGDYLARSLMVLRDQQGQQSVRDMRIQVLEVAGDGDKSLIVFDRPPDIDGTALLTFTHKQGSDDQWLYLPALKRVKRISSSNQSGSFVGSEFAYEDMISPEVEKYTYKWLRDEPCNGLSCFVVERYPAYQDSGYTRQVVWIDKDEYRFHRIEYYDRKNTLLKTLTIAGYSQYLDRYWRADKMLMINHQTGKSTLLAWKDYRFRTGLDERAFQGGSALLQLPLGP